MDSISFQSQIRLVKRADFRNMVDRNFVRVDSPWTIKETAYSKNARTDGVFDCTAMGVTDGDKVLLFHICPTNPKNKDFHKIAAQVSEKIKNLMNPEYLQGFIMGGKADNINSPRSSELFEILEDVLNKLNIQYSKFKGGDFENDVAYNSTKDEWIIGSSLFDNLNSYIDLFKKPENAAKKIFNEVKISKDDELTW